MVFEPTKWEGSTIDVDPDMNYDRIDPEPGLQYLVITGASMDNSTARYSVDCMSLTNNAEFRLTYFFGDKNDTSARPAWVNKKQMGSVASLGIALTGKNYGVIAPKDVIGGVVMADVMVTESEKDGKIRHFARVYKFEPVPRDIAAAYSEIKDGDGNVDQYFVDEETDSSSSEAEE